MVVSSLNSSTASEGRTKATRWPVPVAGAPSMVYSFWPTPPMVLNDDVPPLSKGRLYSGCPVHIMPGVSADRANGFRSAKGSCMICRLSITRPPEAVVVSSNGAAAVTSTVSASCPTCNWVSMSSRPATFSTRPVRTDFLKPAASTLSV